MWVDLIQTVEGLSRTKTDLPEQEGILPADCLCTPSWVFRACPIDFGLTRPLQLHEYTHTHILLDLFLWIEVFPTARLYTEIAQSELFLNHGG